MIVRVRQQTGVLLACLLSVLVLCTLPTEEPAVLAAGLLAATLIVVFAAWHAAPGAFALTGNSGAPPSAQRRRHGAFLRQSNPDTPGRPRPRAPGYAAA